MIGFFRQATGLVVQLAFVLRLGIPVIVAGFAAPASAQSDAVSSYPLKPVRVVIGFAAGGGNDLVARILMPKIGETLGRPMIIENRAGAGGIVAAEIVIKSPPDGYTLLFAPQGTVVTNVVLYQKLPYTPADLAPISLAAGFPYVLAVSGSLPVNSVKELIAWMKSNPGQVNAGVSGGGQQIGLELFKQKTGTNAVIVQYKGANEVAASLMSGTTHLTLIDPGPVLGPMKGGRVRGLAVTSASRLAALPDVPTVGELGFPELEFESWMGLFAPARTPQGIVKRLEGAMVGALKQPDIRTQLEAKLANIVGSTSEQLARKITDGIAQADAVRKSANIPYLD